VAKVVARQREHEQPERAQREPYVAEHGCKWGGLPKRFGDWHTICTRMKVHSDGTGR
jgi:hypothetical protein